MSIPKSQPERVIKLLKENPDRQFTAREIAQELIAQYPDIYKEKFHKGKFENEAQLLCQIVAEIGARKAGIFQQHIAWIDAPRPRRYFYKNKSETNQSEIEQQEEGNKAKVNASNNLEETPTIYSEKDLYQPLMDFLSEEHGLSCMRIREGKSSNTMGQGGNKWLHPDIVAMQRLNKDWCEEVRDCIGSSGMSKVRLWSFEVKKELSIANLRQSFFQAVSNSTWANEGYLVTMQLASKVEDELRMLSSLHGIGVILLNMNNIYESEIRLPSAQRPIIDWQSVNRIAEQNTDFKEYLGQVQAYINSNFFSPKLWNKLP